MSVYLSIRNLYECDIDTEFNDCDGKRRTDPGNPEGTVVRAGRAKVLPRFLGHEDIKKTGCEEARRAGT